MHRRHGRDAEVGFRLADARARASVLRQAALGDVQAGEDFHARHDRARHAAGQHLVQAEHAVDAQAHAHAVARRLDVDVGRREVDRRLEHRVDRVHDRRAAREILQALEVLLRAAFALLVGG